MGEPSPPAGGSHAHAGNNVVTEGVPDFSEPPWRATVPATGGLFTRDQDMKRRGTCVSF